jgi:hypothetical protein
MLRVANVPAEEREQLIESEQLQRGDDRRSKGRQSFLGRAAVANGAGISPDQAKTMLRV